jgi:hypothetical protein
MKGLIFLVTFTAVFFWGSETAEAKHGAGKMGRGGHRSGNGRNFTSRNTSGPRGFAWGYRRNHGLPVNRSFRGGPLANPTDGQTIFRAGRNWLWNAGQGGWNLQQ